jgi:hypothetical protein
MHSFDPTSESPPRQEPEQAFYAQPQAMRETKSRCSMHSSDLTSECPPRQEPEQAFYAQPQAMRESNFTAFHTYNIILFFDF